MATATNAQPTPPPTPHHEEAWVQREPTPPSLTGPVITSEDGKPIVLPIGSGKIIDCGDCTIHC